MDTGQVFSIKKLSIQNWIKKKKVIYSKQRVCVRVQRRVREDALPSKDKQVMRTGAAPRAVAASRPGEGRGKEGVLAGAGTGWRLAPRRKILEARQEKPAAGRETLKETGRKRAGRSTAVTFAQPSTKSPPKVEPLLVNSGVVVGHPPSPGRPGLPGPSARAPGGRRCPPSPGSPPRRSGRRLARARERGRRRRPGQPLRPPAA